MNGSKEFSANFSGGDVGDGGGSEGGGDGVGQVDVLVSGIDATRAAAASAVARGRAVTGAGRATRAAGTARAAATRTVGLSVVILISNFSSGLEQVDGVADGSEHVVAVRGTNVLVDGVGAGTSIEVHVPGADPTGLAVQLLLQTFKVALGDVSQVAALIGAELDSLVVSHGRGAGDEGRKSVSGQESNEGADESGFGEHLFTEVVGVVGA